MKIQRTILHALAASLLLAAQTVTGATVTPPVAGDIFIGFRASGGTGAGTSYLVNIGNDNTFRNATPNQVIDLSSVGDIGADLVATYGASWHTRADLHWGVFGVRNGNSPIVYGSHAQSPVGTASADYPPLSQPARSGTATNIASVIFVYSQSEDAGFSNAAFQSNFSGSASYNYQVSLGGTDFGSLSQWTSIEGGFASGAAGTALDLFRFAGNAVEGDVVDRLGAFTINSSGQVTFTAAPLLKAVKFQQIGYTLNETGGNVTLHFRRSGDTSGAVTATYALNNGTAVAGTDFTTPGSLQVTFNAGESTATANVQVLNRAGYHGTRQFTAELVSATDGFVPRLPSATVVSITDVDPDPGALQFSSATYAASTSNNSVNLTVQRTEATNGAISVDVVVTGGTLVNGTHYSFSSPTTVNFANGATTGNATINLSTIVPGTITLALQNPTSFARLKTPSTATVTVSGEVGTISWGAPTFAYEEINGTVNIPIVRTGGSTGAVQVTVSTTDGTAVSNGTTPDYTAITGQVVTLNDGVGSVNVPVTLFNTVANEPNETFTITLSGATGGASIGTAIATVRILDLDTTVPGVTVTAPAAAAALQLPTGTTSTITGSATDNKGVKEVQITVNGGPIVYATLGTPGGTTTTFTHTFTPISGANSITVRSVDYRNNPSAIATRTFKVLRPLLVTVNGSGTVTAGYSGTTYRDTDKSLTITGTNTTIPAPGSLFTGWTVSWAGNTPTPPAVPTTPAESATRIGVPLNALSKQALTFIFREGLQLTANFVPSPYPVLAGTYNGLAETTSAAADVSANSTEGFFNATLQNTGAFTGKLSIDGFVLNVAGAFDETGVARFGTARATTVVVPRTNKPSLTLGLSISLTPPFKITGTVTQTGYKKSEVVAVSEVVADRAYYGALPLTGSVTLGQPAVTLASTAGRTVGEVVTGTGIPAATTIQAVNSGTVITLNKNATATSAAAALTFTRDLEAYYLGAAAANGTFTAVLPSKAPYYSRSGAFSASTDYFDPGTVTEFENGDLIKFIDNGDLPSELNENDTYFVVNKTGNTFQIEDGSSNTIDFSADGSGDVVLNPDARQTPGYALQDYPQGYGIGTFTVSKAGLVTFNGTLADGTAVTASSTLSEPSPNSAVAIYASLYTAKGFLSGWLTLDKHQADSDLSGQGLKWLRPTQTTSHYYPFGWPDAITVDLLGAKYLATGNVVKRADSGDVDLLGDELLAANLVSGNAELSFGDGQLSEDLTKLVSIAANLVTKVPDNDPTFTLGITAASGALAGTVTHTDDSVPAFKGIIYQKGAVAGGYGHFLTKQPAVIDYTGESGWVELSGKQP